MGKVGQKISKSAKCPLYHKHEKLRLFCDAFAEGGLSTITPFPDEQRRADYMARYCKNPCRWRECPLAKTIGGNDDDP